MPRVVLVDLVVHLLKLALMLVIDLGPFPLMAL
jgi:hypothetical protein